MFPGYVRFVPIRAKQAGPVKVNLSALGARMKEARESLRYSLRQLSQKCGISPSQLLRLESGKVDCSLGLPVGALVEDVTAYGVEFPTEGFPEEVRALLAPKGKGGMASRRKRLDEFMRAHFHAARRLLTDSAPMGVIRDSDFTRGDTKVRYMVVAGMAEGFTNVERVAMLEALRESPYLKLLSLALIKRGMLEEFLDGKDEAIGIKFTPTPAAIKPRPPREPFELRWAESGAK